MLVALRPRGATNVSPPSVTGNVRWASGRRRRGSFDVAAAALAAERNVNKRHQLIGRVRSRRHRHPVIIPVHLQSSMSGHFSASTTTSSSCVATRRIDLLCLTETWHDSDSAVLGHLRRAGYNVVDRPRPRAADDDLSVNHGGVLVVSAADVSLSPIAVIQPTTFEVVCEIYCCCVADGCVHRECLCDMQSWARAAQVYTRSGVAMLHSINHIFLEWSK